MTVNVRKNAGIDFAFAVWGSHNEAHKSRLFFRKTCWTRYICYHFREIVLAMNSLHYQPYSKTFENSTCRSAAERELEGTDLKAYRGTTKICDAVIHACGAEFWHHFRDCYKWR